MSFSIASLSTFVATLAATTYILPASASPMDASVAARDSTTDVNNKIQFVNEFPDKLSSGQEYTFEWKGGSGFYKLSWIAQSENANFLQYFSPTQNPQDKKYTVKLPPARCWENLKYFTFWLEDTAVDKVGLYDQAHSPLMLGVANNDDETECPDDPYLGSSPPA